MSRIMTVVCAPLVVLPILIVNPDFSSGLFEGGEIVCGTVAAVSLARFLGVMVARMARKDPALGAWWGSFSWYLGAVSLSAWIAAGLAGLAAGLLALVMMTILKRRKSTPAIREPVAAAVVVIGVVSFVSVWQLSFAKPTPQVLIVGLDGATWKIIDDLRGEGALPTFDRLIAEGARADLDTLHPVMSPPIWTSIATGVSPERHGVMDFWASAEQVRAKRLWEIADDNGLVSGVFGYLVTWPPSKSTGFLVPGWLAQGDQTYPECLSFAKALEIGEKSGHAWSPIEFTAFGFQALRHGVTLSTLNMGLRYLLSQGQDDRTKAVEGRILKLRFSTDLFCHLVRKTQPSLGIFYNSSMDAIEHLFFKYYEPEAFADVTDEEIALFGSAIPRVYIEADRAIARIIRSGQKHATIVVVSDHGNEATPLKDHWYQVQTTTILEGLGVSTGLRATNVGGSVFLRFTGTAAAMEKIVSDIVSIVTLPDEKALFTLRQIGPREIDLEVRSGFAPEAEIEARIGDRTVPASSLVRRGEEVSGDHTDTAILLMRGPDIVKGKVLPRGSVLDVAPTVLFLSRLPVARDMEGRVFAEAVRRETMQRVGVDYIDTYGVPSAWKPDETDQQLDEETTEKLKSLGYIQ